MNADEALDFLQHLRRAGDELKMGIVLAERARIAPRASLNTALELIVTCEIDWLKVLKRHKYDQEMEL